MKFLHIKNVNKSFPHGFLKKKKILHSVSLDVERGNVVGFIGMNGAGKSTLINLVLGFCYPDSGTISLAGISPAHPSSRASLGYLPETITFYEHLTGFELLKFSCRSLGKIDNRSIKNRSGELLERLGLSQAGGSQIRTYSKGMKQRLGLALALIGDPEFYIFDEPMSGLDPMGRQMVKELMLEEKEKGKTIFFSSHILTDVATLCNKLEVIRSGKIIFSGSVSTFMGDENNLEKRFIEMHITENRSC